MWHKHCNIREGGGTQTIVNLSLFDRFDFGFTGGVLQSVYGKH